MSEVDKFHDFAGSAGVRHEQENVVGLDYTEVAVLCFRRVEIDSRSAG